MCPFEIAFFTWLYAVSPVTWLAVLMEWPVMPSSAPSRALPQHRRSSTAYTLLKRIGTSLRGMWPETQAYGLWESLWWYLVSRGSSVVSHTVISFSVSSHSWGSNMFFFLFACEGVLSHGPASHSRKQQGGMLPGTPGILVPARQVPSPERS